MSNRLTDFKFDSEQEVVTRIVKSVHAAIDRDFPKASPAPPKYSTTVFQNVEDTRNELPSSPSPREKTQKDPVAIPKMDRKHILQIALLVVVFAVLAGVWLFQLFKLQ